MDVLSHLIEEHRMVETMLTVLQGSEEGPEREALVAELVDSLSTHMKVEERFVYPIVKEVVGEEEEQEAETEHGLAREGLAKLQELVSEPGFGAAVDMVKAGIAHHVKEEENEIFPELREKGGDRLVALGDGEELEAQLKSAGDGPGRTKEELYKAAQEANVPGRSSMSKEELEQALEA